MRVTRRRESKGGGRRGRNSKRKITWAMTTQSLRKEKEKEEEEEN